MRVTLGLAALAVGASAIPTELRERQDGHNSKPCPKKPLVTKVSVLNSSRSLYKYTDDLVACSGEGHYHQEIDEGCPAARGLCLQLPRP
jgi:hypothetical protein